MPTAYFTIITHAPGKIILLGEHAVVYGQPALAVPVSQLRATAMLVPAPQCIIDAPDLRRRYPLSAALPDDPIAAAIRLTWNRYAPAGKAPHFELTLTSTIPIASGLGSGAAMSAAVVRAVAGRLGHVLEPAEVSALVFETEKILHGTPSGIDNTVVAFEQPMWFISGQPPQPVTVSGAFHFLIGDTGQPSPTKITVGDVRRAWQANPARYETLFAEIGACVTQGRAALSIGDHYGLGMLMNLNHSLLQALDVSNNTLDTLTQVARDAGALGAKLSGGGRGGNLIALVEEAAAERVRAAWRAAGVRAIHATTLE